MSPDTFHSNPRLLTICTIRFPKKAVAFSPGPCRAQSLPTANFSDPREPARARTTFLETSHQLLFSFPSWTLPMEQGWELNCALRISWQEEHQRATWEPCALPTYFSSKWASQATARTNVNTVISWHLWLNFSGNKGMSCFTILSS